MEVKVQLKMATLGMTLATVEGKLEVKPLVESVSAAVARPIVTEKLIKAFQQAGLQGQFTLDGEVYEV